MFILLDRFKDLVLRFEAWRLTHHERCSPSKRRKTPNIQNPVGEAIGPWDDSLGSADEYELYDKDSFVQSDSDELEYSSGSDDELMDDGGADDHLSEDSDASTSSSVEMVPSGRRTRRRKRTNVILSDEGSAKAGKLGRKYRVQHESP